MERAMKDWEKALVCRGGSQDPDARGEVTREGGRRAPGIPGNEVREGSAEALRAAMDAARAELEVADLRPNRQMCALLVAGEDHRIALHPGVDPLALCRAAWRTYGCGRVEGGSTVAMQLARVLTGRFENSWRRKTREMTLALAATRHAHWRELTSLYLWVGYYGWRMNGLRQACGRLGIEPETCSLRDSARLVARLKYPQPRQCSAARWAQIAKRGEYLRGRLRSDE